LSKLIVIEITPGSPADPITFANSYLTNSLGALQITAYGISFSNPTGVPPALGSATYVPGSNPPPAPPASPGTILSQAPTVGNTYPSGLTSGIIQQIDAYSAFPSSFIQAESVATAVIQIPDPPDAFTNIKLTAQWGSQSIPIGNDFYLQTADLAAAPAPDPNASPWAGLAPNLYLSLPTPPSSASATSFTLPSDGTPPAFDDLLKAVQQVLAIDPGTTTIATSADTPSGTALPFASTAGVQTGMAVSGTNIPANTVVAAVTGTSVTLSRPVTGDVPPGTNITFAADLGDLTAEQCRNVAYEIIWSQQKPVPGVPDPLDRPIEDLYTIPPNTGALLAGSTPNQDEGDRQQFEAGLKSYYATPDSNAERLTSYVYSLSAAVACEQQSLAATRVLLEFPADPAAPAGSPTGDTEVILTGITGSAPPANFGVPAAYFYALAYALPAQMPAGQRYQLATGDRLQHLLGQFTGAINAGVVTDGEVFATLSAPPSINAAQAARRIAALGIPVGSTTPLAPLGALALSTNSDTPSGTALPFASTLGVTAGMAVSGAAMAPNTTVSAVTATSVTLSQPVLGDVPSGAALTFTPPYPAGLAQLLQNWLAFPPAASGMLSSEAYQPGDDDTKFWPGASTAAATAGAFLNLVLAALTQGAIIPLSPPPTTAPLGTLMLEHLAPLTAAPVITTLVSITAAQWSAFFTANPSWLPPFTLPGNTAARIATFIRFVETFFQVVAASPPTTVNPPAAGPLPQLPGPSTDWLRACLTAYGAYTWGSGFNLANLKTAAATVFPGDSAAQAWLVEALLTIDALWNIATTAATGSPGAVTFSIVEALYARGFTSAQSMTELTGADFERALIGTVAYDFAAALYNAAAAISPPLPATPPGPPGFQPVNPDGSLTDCIPPPCLSPLGPVAYLSELLQVSQTSTCDTPLTPADPSALGTVLAQRRGPLGNLHATCANLETPLPLIDIVNESLEFMGSVASPMNGTVYDTSSDAVAGHKLCDEDACHDEDDDGDEGCHDPARLLAALPEYSTPATPVPGVNDTVEPAVWNKLKVDFSACCLPYSQALDVSRTYLRRLRSSRFEEMRTFRRCITEFVLDPTNEPAGFEDYLWRLPVRVDIAIEYLGITPEEYLLLFKGTWPEYCGTPVDQRNPRQLDRIELPSLYGFPQSEDIEAWSRVELTVSQFLAATCIDYCELVELQKSGFVTFAGTSRQEDGQELQLPDCEPCCLEEYVIRFVTPENPFTALAMLFVFIRLWQKLKENGCGYSFAELADICQAFSLFQGTATPNPDFIRELAAFQMLRDWFQLPLLDRHGETPGATGADRTHLLALWAGPSAKKWQWALDRLLEGVQLYARGRFSCERRDDDSVRGLIAHLDELSLLAGFNPQNPPDTWYGRPACTLRFAEVLAKIEASSFRPAELIYLFTAEDDSWSPFPPQTEDDALADPLDLPEGDEHDSLWRLREQLLRVEIDEEEARDWTWPRMVEEFGRAFGYAPPAGQDPLLSIGRHFFPGVLEASGYSVTGQQRQYRSSPLSTSAPWNTLPGSPFQFDSVAGELWTELPLRDEAVAAGLSQLPALTAAEQVAVQDLYFAPRADLAFVAFIFPDWERAEHELIEEPHEHERWEYFRRHFALAHARRRVLAEHLARQVARHTECDHENLVELSSVILRSLLADENKALSPWESDSGAPPSVTWSPSPSGGAIAALLGLAGTGLLGEYSAVQQPTDANPVAGSDGAAPSVVWREVRGPLTAFGEARNHTDSPVPTVLPALAFSESGLPASVKIHNGYAIDSDDGRRLGGAEGVQVRWSGVLLVDCEGEYAFHGGAPAPEGERPDFERAEHSKWRLTLQRGARNWLVLNHQWPGAAGSAQHVLRLRRGAYQIAVDFQAPTPDFAHEAHLHRQRTGFQVKYEGPDSDGCLVALPLSHLYRDVKDDTLAQGITFLPGSTSAQAFLSAYYTSTLRDVRRTYQRAFKALLFAARLGLSGRRIHEYGQSELGYMLANPANFAGSAYYRIGGSGTFTQHLADFDFDFLPLQDNYHPPTPVPPDRSQPSPQRTQAMFDWWERLFDYTRARDAVEDRCDRRLWLLFDEAQTSPPADPADLLGHMCSPNDYRHLQLRYYQDEFSPVYSLTSSDLQDDRWVVRAWHAGGWLRAMLHSFRAKNVSVARPDLWASDDPSALVPPETQTGNANLSAFLCDGYLEIGEPHRYEDLKKLNDGLRERGRDALVAYLTHMNRVALPWAAGKFVQAPQQLSDVLLLDVQTGIREQASRIDDAISAVQNFVQRARLHLEPGWTVSHELALLWDRRFATFRLWQECRRRELYKENWIEWEELEHARGVEAFRFLESQLRNAALSIAVPGSLDWWPDDRPATHPSLEVLQAAEPATERLLPAPREGLNLLGTPDWGGQPSWLAAVPSQIANTGGDGNRPADSAPPPPTAAPELPYWLEAAMRLGRRFYRIAAAGMPLAADGFEPHRRDGDAGVCVEHCVECGCTHPPHMDEYYFWLVDGEIYSPPQASPQGLAPDDYQYGYQDDYYDPTQQQSTVWEDETQLAQALDWQPTPMVRLAWCRVHNGEFQQPRRSAGGIPVLSLSGADFSFLGRTADSLTFSVTNPDPSIVFPPWSSYADTVDVPGFRFDIAADEAVTLPLVETPPTPSLPAYLSPLPAYPYFVFEAPGTHLLPLSPFGPALAVASTLRTHCRFEAALNWYRTAFDPLASDCAWVHCGTGAAPSPPPTTGDGNIPLPSPNTPPGVTTPPASNAGPARLEPTGVVDAAPVTPPAVIVRGGGGETACCDSTDITCDAARDRATLLHYLETLRDWGQAAMRANSPEAFQHARLIFGTAATILGERPRAIQLPEPANPPTVTTFQPYYAPLNPRLIDLYDVIHDRLELIHAYVDARRLRDDNMDHGMPYFGDNPLREGWHRVDEVCAGEGDWCYLPSPYRFQFLIQKALEHAGRLREIRGELLSAFEKGDASYLESRNAQHERELLTLGLAAQQDQWRDADWQVESMQKAKAASQADLAYFNGLIQQGLINDEIQYQDLIEASTVLRAAANISEGIAAALGAVPNIFSGVAGFGGSPLFYTQIPGIGTPGAQVLSTVARISNGLAEIASATAGLDLTEAGWERRAVEWQHQVQKLTIQIEQQEIDILRLQRQRDQRLQELNISQRRLEHSAQVLNFLRDKFTADDRYLYLQRKTAEYYYERFELCLRMAQQAEHAFNFERGNTSRHFLPNCSWNSLQEGLMVGEELDAALRTMEREYLDENVREYELTKHFSLRTHFPLAYLQLRRTGHCEIEIPEWMYDQDYPGHYMRRIKNVTLTIPCVAGPYTGVHCRLTLLSDTTRIDPRLDPPAHRCCCADDDRNPYELCPDDPRAVRIHAAQEAIATSSGQNDSGLFELNFRDERLLPFEFRGAVCRMRFELPLETNYVDRDTFTDIILNVNYTSREGGELLRRAAGELAERHLPGGGWAFFDVRHDFPDAWQLFEGFPGDHAARELPLSLNRRMFPFLPKSGEIMIDQLVLMFSDSGDSEGGWQIVKFSSHHEHSRGWEQEREREHEHEQGREWEDVYCLAGAGWPELYFGIVDANLGPIGPDREPAHAYMRFPEDTGRIREAFLFCRYSAVRHENRRTLMGAQDWESLHRLESFRGKEVDRSIEDGYGSTERERAREQIQER
jgi:Tc toxin complex TcA C-terminal TcB-binding domain